MNTPKHDIPWELISESLTGNLNSDEKIKFQQWLTDSSENREKYSELEELWNKDINDYLLYRKADENRAWNDLQLKIINPVTPETKVIYGLFTQKKRLFRKVIAIAAVFLVFAGIGLLLVPTRNKPVIYETTSAMHKKVILKDGSSVTLSPLTRIEVSAEYNKNNRTLSMISGMASFDVVHRTDKPFIVKLGTTQIVDVGTSFTIGKGEKEIRVSVTSGKIVFSKLDTKEAKELTEGTSITFNISNKRFGVLKSDKTSSSGEDLLNFENTPLSEVILTLQKVYGKKVILHNQEIVNKKLTAKLNGMPFHTAIKIICKSLGLEYTLHDSVYIVN
jgi:transmembrane sensor